MSLLYNSSYPTRRERYTCDYGACIDLANKCNSKIECHDESDETTCQYLEVPEPLLVYLYPRYLSSMPAG